jgi:hypothetical protein
MTTREQIIAAAKEVDAYRYVNRAAKDEPTHTFTMDKLERFYTIVANRTKDQCAALCYEQNWELRGEEMSEMILATKEEVK